MQSDPSNLVFILNFNGLNTFAGGRRIKKYAADQGRTDTHNVDNVGH